jgi:hypothetical protein
MTTPLTAERHDRVADRRRRLERDWTELKDRWKLSIRTAFAASKVTQANLDQASGLRDAVRAERARLERAVSPKERGGVCRV